MGTKSSTAPISPRPSLRKARSTRQEQQELAQGDRVRLTEANPKLKTQKGDFGTITSLSEADGLTIRLDKGPTVHLTNEQARYIEHGYAVDSLRKGAPERILVTHDGSLQVMSEVAFLARAGREVNVYSSNGSVQAQAQTPSIARSQDLRTSIAVLEQQQMELQRTSSCPNRGRP